MAEEKKLNFAQKEAIHHNNGPLLIIAGAGTGKTTVITERVNWLLSNNFAKPEEILCLTFTEKAALEMETRIDRVLPYGYAQLWVTTFHSFCDRVLRDEAINIGLDPNYKLFTETDSVSLLESSLFSLPLNYYRPLGNPQKFLQGLLQHLGRLKDEDVSITDYENFANRVTDENEKQRYLELAALYKSYEELKISKSVMDFSDLISNCLKLFRERPNILKIYQKKFRYILVDEYQDTNYSQNILVNLLSGDDQNLTVVADDDQAIYRWRGAAVSNVIQFRKTYPKAKLIVLTENYRSTQTILDSSYSLIQNNNPDRLEVKENLDKHLLSAKKIIGEKVEFIHTKRVDQESDFVVKKIKQLQQESDLKFSDFAILVRANAHADPFIRSLSYSGIPYKFLGPTKLFESTEVIDLIAYLQLLNDFTQDISMYKVLANPYYQISGRDLVGISSFSKKINRSIYESCEIILGKTVTPTGVTLPSISELTIKTIEKIMGIIIQNLELLKTRPVGQVVYEYLSQSGMLKSIVEFNEPFTQDKSLNIIKIFEKIKSYETIHPKATLSQIVKWLEFVSQYGESSQSSDQENQDEDSVNILTIHASKGLEFEVVFVVNLVSQRFPSTQRREQIPIPDELVKEELPQGDFHLQEERRLCYVAATRARSKLFLSAADFYGDGKRQKKLSPFISELMGHNFVQDKLVEDLKQLSLLEISEVKEVEQVIEKSNNKLRVDYLSYSQIQTFITCPLHYKAKYILNIPTPPSAASSFGNTIHLTFKDFYNLVSRLDTILDTSKYQDLITEIYKKDWTSIGYTDRKHEELYFNKGVNYLRDFISEEFNPHRLPIKLEEPFTIPIVSADGKRLIKIGGKMDRVDVLDDGSIEIIDYKTSAEAMDQKEADNGLQLSFYALAASTLPNHPFGKKPHEIKLTLYYFETKEKIKTTRTQEQLEKAKEEIFSYALEIENSDFKCSRSPLCKSCDFQLLCNSRE